MIREFIARLKKSSKKIAEVLISKIGSAIHQYELLYPPAARESARLFADHLADNSNRNGNLGGAR
jgi:hypothetical protein